MSAIRRVPVPHPRAGRPSARRLVVLLTPVAVPVSMAAVFRALGRRLPPRSAYNVGFAVYWAGWCVGVPVAVLGPRRALRVLTSGRRPTSGETVALLLPVLGGAFSEFLPRRQLVDRRVLAMMIGSAAVNAVGEELLWRGMFVETFPDDPVRGSSGRSRASASGTWRRRSSSPPGTAVSGSSREPPPWGGVLVRVLAGARPALGGPPSPRHGRLRGDGRAFPPRPRRAHRSPRPPALPRVRVSSGPMPLPCARLRDEARCGGGMT